MKLDVELVDKGSYVGEDGTPKRKLVGRIGDVHIRVSGPDADVLALMKTQKIAVAKAKTVAEGAKTRKVADVSFGELKAAYKGGSAILTVDGDKTYVALGHKTYKLTARQAEALKS